MKLTILLLTAAFLNVHAKGVAQTVTLSGKDLTLKQVFTAIEKQTGHVVFHKKGLLTDSKSVSLTVYDMPLADLLQAVLKDQPLDFSIDGKNIILSRKTQLPVVSSNRPALTAQPPIKIRVVDADGQPLSGASVTNKNTKNSGVTNAEGVFNLNVTEGDVLLVSYVGYETRSVLVTLSMLSSTNNLVITLRPSVTKLDDVEIVSTGYQTLPKERATGSFTTIDNELLNRRVSTNIIDRLQGVASSVLFNANIPTLSTETPFSVRGRSTILSNTQPLIVLDNFAYDGDLNNINPNDIESITILKDAAAASIWGVRSGNGVIVITSKKGKTKQALNIELNANYTIGNKPDLFYSPNFLNASDYIDNEIFLFGKGYYDANLNSTTTRPVISPVVEILAAQRNNTLSDIEANAKIDSLRGYDVRNDYEKYLYRKNLTSQYALNLRGGAEKFSYYLSAGYDKNISNIVGNRNDRLNLNAISTFTPLKNLEIGLGLNFTESNSEDNSSGASINPANKSAYYPYARLADDNGNPLALEKTYRSSFLNAQPGMLDWQYRPIEEIDLSDNTTKINYTRIIPSIRYRILPGIHIEARYQYESSHTNNKNLQSIDTYFTRDLINLYTQGSGASATFPVPKGDIFDQTQTILKGNTFRANLQIDKQIINPEHSVSAIAGIESKELISERNRSRLYGFDPTVTTSVAVNNDSSYARYKNLASTSRVPYVNSFSRNTDIYMSYFSNAAYNYKGRYTLSGSARIDQSNLFGVNTNQKSIPLWSAGASWNIAQEPFYKVSWLPYLKARITYGENGNINKSLTAYTTALFLPSPITSARTARISNPPNADLRWERNKMLNIGIDFDTKIRFLAGSIEYYFKKGTDLLGLAPLDPTTGITQYTGNLANMTGQGIDIDLNGMILEGDFKWQSFLLASWNTDKVTKYDDIPAIRSYVQSGDGLGGVSINPIVGKPVYSISSYKWAGLDPNTGDPQGLINGEISKNYTALTASSLTPEDLVYNGPARPNIFGAFRNEFSYRNFNLSVNITFKLNYYFRRPSIQYSNFFGSWLANTDYSKRWQKPGDELITDVPSIVYPANTNRNNFYQYSEALVEKGDHIRLQDIQASYSIDTKTLRRLGMRKVQFYAYINNIGLIWKANKVGLDPDAVRQYSYLMYPNPTTIALGFKANF